MLALHKEIAKLSLKPVDGISIIANSADISSIQAEILGPPGIKTTPVLYTL
jgi:hypothetical protein